MAIEDDLIGRPHLVRIDHRGAAATGNCRDQPLALGLLAQVRRGRIDADQHLRALSGQVRDRIVRVIAASIVPCVLADQEADALTLPIKNPAGRAWFEVTPFMEHVVGGQLLLRHAAEDATAVLSAYGRLRDATVEW